jgi:energy-coupling factor transporter transmembrane protein EcfT
MLSLCSPALVYLAFSITQIIIDFFKGHPNVALMKIIVTAIFTVMLEFLCRQGLTWMSWIIVFIPFIFLSVIVGILLFVFGYDPETGSINVECSNCQEDENEIKGNLVFSTAKYDTNIETTTTTTSESEGPTIVYSTGFGDEYKGYSMYPYGTSDLQFS